MSTHKKLGENVNKIDLSTDDDNNYLLNKTKHQFVYYIKIDTHQTNQQNIKNHSLTPLIKRIQTF